MALPNFNFQPFVSPYVPRPTQELNNAISGLRRDYEQGLLFEEQARQALSSTRATFSKDQEILNSFNNEMLNTLNSAQDSGDYENQVSKLKRSLGKYVANVKPIINRNQELENIRNLALQQGSDPNRVMNAIYAQEQLNPTITNENGFVQSSFDPQSANKFIAKPVDLVTELSKTAEFVKPELIQGVLSSSIETRDTPQGEYTFLVEVNGSKKFVKSSEVRDLLNQRIEQDDIQKYLRSEKELYKSEKLTELLEKGVDFNSAIAQSETYSQNEIDSLMNNVIEPVVNSASYMQKSTDQNLKPLGTSNKKSSGSGETKPKELIYNITDGTMFQNVDVDFSSVKNRISELSNLSSPSYEQKEELGQLTLLQNSIHDEITKNFDISKFYKIYNDTYSDLTKKYNALSKKDIAGNVTGSITKPEKKFNTIEEFKNGLLNPDEFTAYTNNFITQLGNAISPTHEGEFQNAYNEYWNKIKDYQQKIKIAKSPQVITAPKGTVIGDINDNLTNSFINNQLNFKLLTTGENLNNKNHLVEKYGRINEPVEVGDREFVLGRDPDKDVLSVTGSTFNGIPIYQLTIHNKDNQILGSELIYGRKEDGLRQQRQVARQIYDQDPTKAMEILSNTDLLPQIQTSDIYYGNAEKELGDLKITNPISGNTITMSKYKIRTAKDASGNYLGITLIAPNGDILNTYKSEEELSFNIYKEMLNQSNNN